MDLIILTGIAGALFVILFAVYFIRSKRTTSDIEGVARPRIGVHPNEVAIPRRAQIVRNQRNRLRLNVFNNRVQEQEGYDELHDNEEHEILCGPKNQKTDERVGTKKRAKIEAKEAKRRQREEELRQREDRKLQEAKIEEERQRDVKKQIEEERKQREAERLAHEELVRKEYEDYLAMKESFNIEEEGFEEPVDSKEENTLLKFINYIKDNKVVDLEGLAIEFKLKTQQVIDRIQELQINGSLTGVIDDRGKFIYISEVELNNVAKFIKQRGRVSISELAECSNSLIGLSTMSN